MRKIKDNIVESVVEKYIERSEKGIEKYGTTLQNNLLTFDEWINHLQEELMDATLYLEKIKKLGINNAQKLN
jgi:preprotein translocase subunit SecA